MDLFPQMFVHDANQKRWVISDNPAAVDDPRQPVQSLQIISATCLLHGLFTFFMVLEVAIRSNTSSALTREYQTSSSPISEYSAIRCRYDVTALRAALRQSESPNPFSRRSEEHTSELQSRQYLVCRLLLEKKQSMRH